LAAMTSIFSQRTVKSSVALTGEITLRGSVLPVGGIKEKVLAARRAGIKHVILPKKNEKDVKEIESEVIEGLKFTYLERMDDLFQLVLESKAIIEPKNKFAARQKSDQSGSSTLKM